MLTPAISVQAARSTADPRDGKQVPGRSAADVNKTTLKALPMLLPMPPRLRRFASLRYLRRMAVPLTPCAALSTLSSTCQQEALDPEQLPHAAKHPERSLQQMDYMSNNAFLMPKTPPLVRAFRLHSVALLPEPGQQSRLTPQHPRGS